MRVLIQWATSTPGDWTAYELNEMRDVRALPRRGVPTGNPLDSQPGWIAGVNVQGVVFTGYDHIGFELLAGVLVVKAWNDDPDDYPDGTRWGQVWTFAPPAPDARLGGRVNTVQSVTWYGEPDCTPIRLGVTPVLPWVDFVPAPNRQTLHGIWMTDEQWSAHLAAQSVRGWREWTTA